MRRMNFRPVRLHLPVAGSVLTRSGMLALLVSVAGGLTIATTDLRAQDPGEASSTRRSIDRWLVTTSSSRPGADDPLSAEGSRVFPDRDLDLGPGYWTLVREDGQRTFHFDGSIPEDPRAVATLAHAYLKSPRDATIGLEVGADECAGTRAWLNGQPLVLATGDDETGDDATTVRVAAGWNTLLVSTERRDDCDAALSVALARPDVPLDTDEDPPELEEMRIQASRPPGARPNYPAGSIQVGTPTVAELAWMAGDRTMVATVEYTLTAWGAGGGLGILAASGAERPTGPPTIDLSGEWMITLYTPTGIQEAEGDLAMAPDGTLTGRFQGERLEGDIKDGWVSGDEFGWTMRFPGRGRALEIDIRGVLVDGMMQGTLDFGGFAAFDARIEGERIFVETAESTEETTSDEQTTSGEETTSGEQTTSGEEATLDESELGDEQDDPREAPSGGDGPPGRVPGNPDDPGVADPTGERAQIARRLRPPLQRMGAPTGGTIELEVSGQKLEGSASDLEPVSAITLRGEVALDRVRDAALSEDGVRAKARWQDEDHDFEGTISAASLLAALHRPIELRGWALSGPEGRLGTFRVPDALDGFTLLIEGGTWTVNGSSVPGGVLCSPCERGAEMEIRVVGPEAPAVTVQEPGYPTASRNGPDARTWLRALHGDNEEYRELGRTHGGQNPARGSSAAS